MLKRALPFFVPLIAGIALACILAADSDQLHLYRTWPDSGAAENWHGVLSSRFMEHLPWSLAVGMTAIAVLWAPAAWRRVRSNGVSLARALEHTALPFITLWLGLLAPLRYLPGVADWGAFPFLLVTTLLKPLLYVALLLTLYGLWRSGSPGQDGEKLQPDRPALSDRATGWLVALVACVILAPLATWYYFVSPFGGDQPHYLIVTHSLIEDGDIYIEDDHAAGAYRTFTDHEIDPQYYRRTAEGHIIQAHKFGLSILAVPFYLVGGKLGALLLIAALAALCAAGTYWLTIKFVPDRRAALAATAWVVFTVPALPMSLLFFTEIPSAAFLLLALNLLIQPEAKKPVRWPWLVPFIIWAMPWLHVRNFVVAFLLSGMLVWRLRKHQPAPITLGALCIVLALGIPVFNMVMYGDFSPVAELGPLQGKDLQFGNVLRSAGGLLFDQEFGLLLTNPLVLAAIFGLWSLWRRQPWAVGLVVLTVGLSLGPTMLYQMWWGGGSPPARYVAADIHLLALPLAALLSARRDKRGAGLMALGIAIAIALGLTLIADPLTLVNNRDGSANLLTNISLGPLDAVEWWPSCIAGESRACPLAGALSFAFAIFFGAWYLISRLLYNVPGWGRGGIVLFSAIFIAGGYTVIAETISPGEANGMAPTSHASDSALQQRMRDGSSAIVPIFPKDGDILPPPRRFSAEMYAPRERLSADPLAGRGRSLAMSAGEWAMDFPEVLYAGDYRFIIGVRAENAPAHITARIYSAASAGAAGFPLGRAEFVIGSDRFAEIVIPGATPYNISGLMLALSTDQPIRFTHLVAQPVDFHTGERSHGPAAIADLVSWDLEGLVLFTGPDDIYPPERTGFWTRGNFESVWQIGSRQEVSRLSMTVRARPGMRLTVGGTVIEFGPRDGTKRIEIPTQSWKHADRWYSPLPIRLEGSFIPAEIEPESTDTRRLGVFISLENPAIGSRNNR